MSEQPLQRRFFTTYTGVSLPLRLVDELDGEGIDQRITYFIGYYDDQDRLTVLEKMVYGELEFSHHYEYGVGGALIKAVLTEDDGDSVRTLEFDAQGQAREITEHA